jgi:hypothetical protein
MRLLIVALALCILLQTDGAISTTTPTTADNNDDEAAIITDTDDTTANTAAADTAPPRHGPATTQELRASHPIPRSIKVSGQVPSFDWQPTEAFTHECVRNDQPVLLKQTAASTWPAMQKWDLDFFRALDLQYKGVQKTADFGKVFYPNHATPLSDVDVVADAYAPRVAGVVDLTSDVFFAALLNGTDEVVVVNKVDDKADNDKADDKSAAATKDEEEPATTHFHYAFTAQLDAVFDACVKAHPASAERVDKAAALARATAVAAGVDDGGDAAAAEAAANTYDPACVAVYRDVAPIAPLGVPHSKATARTQFRHRKTSVELAGDGSIRQPAYDEMHSVRAQVYGRARVLVFPPEAWERIYPFPMMHPGQRSAQVNFTRPDRAAFPHWRRAHAQEAILEPGDVLYVPPMWFTRTESLEPSVAVTVRSTFEAADLYTRVVEKSPVPVLAAWNAELRVQVRVARPSFSRLLIQLAFITCLSFIHCNLTIPSRHFFYSFRACVISLTTCSRRSTWASTRKSSCTRACCTAGTCTWAPTRATMSGGVSR